MTNNKENTSQALVNDLEKVINGEVRADLLTRRIYATDASDFCKVPVGVVIPKDADDVCAAIETAARHHIPVIPRGGGSSLSGQTVGTGLVIDHSKYMNRILEINPEEQWVRVQPGVVLDTLNAALAPHNLMIGPDPSSSAVATMAGMAGNNSTGSHSFRYGMMADHIHEMEVILSDGSKVLFDGKDPATVNFLAGQNSLEAALYREIPSLLDQYREDILTGYPNTWRNVAGYGLNRLLDAQTNNAPFSLAPLIAGSEGTLGLISQLKLAVVERPRVINLLILHYPSMEQALEMVPAILEHQPAAVELMTSPSIKLADGHAGFRPLLRKFVQGNPGAILIVEFGESSQAKVDSGIGKLRAWLDGQGYKEPITLCDTPEKIGTVWQVRKAIIGLLVSKPGDDQPIWIIDDATVPVDQLTDYTRDVKAAGKKVGIDINFDAHASAGCLHMGLELNMKTQKGLSHLELLSKEIMDIAIAHGGTTTGEHGEGLARSYFTEKLYGKRLYEAFKSVKSTFDPDHRLNPNKIINPIEPWDKEWLRYSPDYKTPLNPKQTFMDFGDYGGFSGLVEMCNGMGVCRSMETGTMCPSYRATREELHTPRGRSNILRAAISGKLGDKGLLDKMVYQAMELCIECKACRKECASKVDVAKLKYEFLAQYQQAHGVPLRSRMFGAMALADSLGSKVPALANALYKNKLFRKLLDSAVKIDARRELPLMAGETFQQWFYRRSARPAGPSGPVILWDDCHLSYHEPQIGVAAVTVLEAAGFEVVLVKKRQCCGRPMISKGLLKKAAANARHNIRLLSADKFKDIPMVGIEPSCIACFKDEYPDLVKSEEAGQVAKRSFFFEEFIMNLASQGKLALPFHETGNPKAVHVHTHCYQKSLGTAPKVVEMLKLIPGTTVTEIGSGCCGMAGAFGYEKEHYEISMAIGEQSLFPAVRSAPEGAVIAAAGTSCRTQIKDGTSTKALHPIEVLARAVSSH